jgi:hypothetical protein
MREQEIFSLSKIVSKKFNSNYKNLNRRRANFDSAFYRCCLLPAA